MVSGTSGVRQSHGLTRLRERRDGGRGRAVPCEGAPGGRTGETPGGPDPSEWDRPLGEEDAPWQPVWALGGRFTHPGRRPPAPGANRRAPLHRELSRPRLGGVGGRAWHWLAVALALAALLAALRLLAGGAQEAGVPAGWHAFAGDGYRGALPPNWRHVDGAALDYLIVEVPATAEPTGPGGRRRVTGPPAHAYAAVTIGPCRPAAVSDGEAQRRWAEELRAGGAALSVTRIVEVEGRGYQLLEVVTAAGVSWRLLPVSVDGCAREFALTPVEGAVGVEEFSAVLGTLRLGAE